LTGLILRFSGFEDDDVVYLANNALLPLAHQAAQEGDWEHALYLANNAPLATRLTTLDLYGALDLYGGAFGWEGLAALLRSQHLFGVQTLVLNDNDNLDENVAEAFAGPDMRMTGLTTLRLGFTSIGDNGARGLAASPHLRSLQTLDVNNCGIGPEGVQALVESPNLQGLTLLDLRGNALSPGVRKRLRARLGDRVKV
jgi:hypothetical protein